MALPRPDDWFGRILSELKRAGCSLLVAGPLPADAVDRVVARMLGRKPGRRARVLGLFGPDVDAARRRLDRVPDGLGPAVVVTTAETPRSAGVEASRPGRSLDVRTARHDPDVFEAELRAAVDEVRRHRGPFDPGELRVGVESLRTIHDGAGRGGVEAFVDRVAGDVRSAGGMAHFVYRSNSERGRPAWLDRRFDVVVAHRTGPDGLQQRWRFPDRGRSTDWFPLE